MKYLRQWKKRASFLLISLIFASVITAPNVMAASGYTWTDMSTGNSAITGKGWQSVASSSSGSHLAAVAFGGDIFTSANSGATWTDVSTGNSAITNQNWLSVASSSDGSHLVAVVGGGDIFTAYDPALVPPPSSNNNASGGSNTSSPSPVNKPKAPNTGYGQPIQSNNPVILGLSTVALISVGGGLFMLYRQQKRSS